MSHEIYYTFYLQGGETDYHVHRKSTCISGDILVFLIAHTCVLYINGIAKISVCCTGIQQMNHADCAFHVCMGVIRLMLESKSIGIHEIPVPQNWIHSVRQTSRGVYVYETIPWNKIPSNLLPTKIFNYLVVQKSAESYTLDNFTYTV